MDFASQLETVPLSRLRQAPWNYKKPGNPEDIARLAASIRHDGSAGVLPVRTVPDTDLLEVMDGNHRLEALALLAETDPQWNAVRVENFGPVTVARAVLIARRRNYQWFDDDLTVLGALYRDEVMTEFDADTLDEFMPEGATGIQNLIDMLDFQWPDDPTARAAGNEDSEVAALWHAWTAYCKTHNLKTKHDMMRLALRTALEAVGHLPQGDSDADNSEVV